MSEQEILSARERAVEALGTAMLAAIALTVGEYMNGRGEELLPPTGEETKGVQRQEGVNENFDLARFYRLRGLGAAKENGTAPKEERPAREEEEIAAAALRERRADLPPTEERESFAPQLQAEELSERFERDARRYDGVFRTYE